MTVNDRQSTSVGLHKSNTYSFKSICFSNSTGDLDGATNHIESMECKHPMDSSPFWSLNSVRFVPSAFRVVEMGKKVLTAAVDSAVFSSTLCAGKKTNPLLPCRGEFQSPHASTTRVIQDPNTATTTTTTKGEKKKKGA